MQIYLNRSFRDIKARSDALFSYTQLIVNILSETKLNILNN